MNRIIPVVLALLCSLCAYGQSQDVQTFTYESTTRDTLIQFPEGDHNRFEKIIMHYSMRCKDALVSTGSDRNRGCGEWDYSCNTYIVDSTRVDSVKARSAEFDMPGFSGDVFEYTDREPFEYYQSVQKQVTLNDIVIEDSHVFTAAVNPDVNGLFEEGSGINMYFIISKDWMIDEDIDKIMSLTLPTSSSASLKNLRVDIAETDQSAVSDALLDRQLQWNNHYYSDTELTEENNRIVFHDTYRWDDTSNILVSLSFDDSELGALSLMTDSIQADQALICKKADAQYVRCGTSGRIFLEEGLEELSTEVTIAFWQRGAETLPVNSTIIEAVDAQNRRQLNIHLPWGNSQVYWDCGNDGGGYDRINKTANPEDFRQEWNHWAFTKNSATGLMAIYLNGELWHSGTDKNKNIDARQLTIGANHTASLYYYGDMDELIIMDKALDAAEVRALLFQPESVTEADPSSVLLYYDFNGLTGENAPVDKSAYARESQLIGQLAYPDWRASELFLDASETEIMPALNVVFGGYRTSVMDSIVLDSVPVLPQRVNHYVLNGTDLELQWTEYYYMAGDYPVYDLDGAVIDQVSFPAAGQFEKGELIYYSKSPMAYEIMSFVTPYGIGLDFGEEGYTWQFDVTDFAPVLKGDKRLFMSRGGQWQEDMDIRFEFIEGIPDRDVIDIQQIWKVDQIPYGNILDDWRFEPREFTYDPSVSAYMIKTAITGHGQEGEFIPRNHSISLDGFIDSWSVWKECAENPVYPQGGTWVYDRAGWCPGMATDVRAFDVSEYFQFLETPTIDYSMQGASGDSRYIVNAQLIKYGPPNKTYDAAVKDVIHPSTRIEHGRFNPSCHAPEIIIKNHGSETLTSLLVHYGVEGKTEKTYTWNGVLPFLIETKLVLPYDPALALAETGDRFFARVEMPGLTDENPSNNSYQTELVPSDHYDGPFIIEWRTNFTPQETSYRVEDESGNILLQKFGASLNSNRIYRDTLYNLNGCYRLFINDTDDDGISWWANNDGNGYIRVKQDGGNWKSVATDFGAFIDYSFTAGSISSVNGLLVDNAVLAYPNPSMGEIYISGLDNWNSDIKVLITDALGRQIYGGSIGKEQLKSGGMTELLNVNSGMYVLHLSDKERYATIKLSRL